MTDTEAWRMLQTMARMQEAHNVQVHSQWRTEGYPYYRAVWVECAELLDHYGWKWWKHQQPDADQVKLEIVDIWHFGLSDLLRADALTAAIAEQLAAVPASAQADGEGFRLAVENLAQQTLSDRVFAMAPFLAVLETLPMGLDELFRLYVGKNVLNHFRQDHGYKSGEYRKTWHGREDNAHLVDLLQTLDTPAEQVPERLYEALELRYRDRGGSDD